MSRLDWLTADIVAASTGAPRARAETWLPHLVQACEAYDINTPARLAAFFAQIGHESGSLRYVSEVWGPTEAQKRYEGRLDLGNTQPGDGSRFRGHGLIQITGRANHAAVRDGLRERLFDPPDFEADPEALMHSQWAALSAAWFWHSRKLNALADAPGLSSFDAITKRINGGQNGQADRRARWDAAKAALLPQSAPNPAPEPRERVTEVAAPPTRPIPAEESVMAPFVAAALPFVIEAVPKLASIFSSGSQTAERNIKAVETVVQVAKEAIGAANEQELVERLQSDPAAATAVRDAIEKNWFEIHQATEKSIAAAREFTTTYTAQKDVRTVLWGFTFIEVLALLVVLISAGGALGYLFWGNPTAELKGAIVTLMLIGGWTGILAFFFGSSPVEQAKAKMADR